jgi:mRNA interferase MazF
MEGPVRGDIVVIPFPFSDLSAAKRRPALVLALLDDNDVLLCQVTSRHRPGLNAIAIGPDDFASGGLPVESFARCGKLFAADSSIIEKRAGTLRPSCLQKIAELNAAIVLGRDAQSEPA